MEFKTKKKFGQNFINEKNLLSAICDDARISCEDNVLEIGPGLGTLTEEISKRAKYVLSYEIDKDLKPILESKKLENVEFIFNDIMKVDLSEIERKIQGDYILVANLPYYITTPILFKFLANSKKLKSLIVMVQKEVAERMVAKEGDKDYGVLTVSIAVCGEAKITRFVDRNMFNPVPNVDSAVVKIDLNNKYDLDFKELFEFVKNIFSMRRKTLANNIMHNYKLNREELKKIFLEKDLNNRAENFSVEKIVELYNNLKNYFNNPI